MSQADEVPLAVVGLQGAMEIFLWPTWIIGLPGTGCAFLDHLTPIVAYLLEGFAPVTELEQSLPPEAAFKNEGTRQPKLDARVDFDRSQDENWSFSGGLSRTSGIVFWRGSCQYVYPMWVWSIMWCHFPPASVSL
jgi:hypothetical protein